MNVAAGKAATTQAAFLCVGLTHPMSCTSTAILLILQVLVPAYQHLKENQTEQHAIHAEVLLEGRAVLHKTPVAAAMCRKYPVPTAFVIVAIPCAEPQDIPGYAILPVAISVVQDMNAQRTMP